jgi:bacterioferritin
MPQGKTKVLDVLNDVLSAELTAINQYFVHAEMCGNWGYQRLHGRIRKDAIDEMKHAEALIERILYLQGAPNVTKLGRIAIGQTVLEQLKADLALELDALPRLNKAIAVCTDEGDNGTRELLEHILQDEEEHTDRLEAQLALIEQVGVQNYLAQQISAEE